MSPKVFPKGIKHRLKDNSQDRKGSRIYRTELAGEGRVSQSVDITLLHTVKCHALSSSSITKPCEQGRTQQKNFHVNKWNRRLPLHCREENGKHGWGGGRDNLNQAMMTLKLGLAVTAQEKGHWNHHWLFSEISDSDRDSQTS